MMRSMFSGVSGLRVHQTKMDVIANNISNVNTVGYKGSRVTFNEVFSQTIGSASSANAATGRAGTNPMQIGLGANIASIDKMMSNGASERTDYWSDLMIEGDGFFIVNDASGQYFTRAGNFTFNLEDGTFSLNGMKLNGWDAVAERDSNNQLTGKYTIDKGIVSPLLITGDKVYSPPSATTSVDFTGNLNPDAGIDIERPMDFFDSLGNKYTMDMVFTKSNVSTDTSVTPNRQVTVWTVSPKPLTDPITGAQDYTQTQIYPNGVRTNGLPITLSVPGSTSNAFPQLVAFDEGGYLVSATTGSTASITGFKLDFTNVTAGNGLPSAATFGENGIVNFDFSGITQFKSDNSSIKAVYRDGGESGTLQSLSVGPDGIVRGFYSNGAEKTLCQIPLAMFSNPAGLEKVGNNLFRSTANSGEFDGIGSDGVIRSGNLEMSNVDLSQEFTQMITTQRGFQANSRIITTSDEMLQELVNLKR